MFWILVLAGVLVLAAIVLGCVFGIGGIGIGGKTSPDGAATTATVTATAAATATASSTSTPEGGLEAMDQVVRTGLTPARFKVESEKWASAGYDLALLSGYGLGTDDRYAAVWSASSSSSSSSSTSTNPGLSSAQYQADFDTMAARGYSLVQVDAWTVGAGEDRYAAVWKDPRGAAAPAFAARHGLLPSELPAEHQKWTARGYCMRCVSGYAAGAEARYTALWTADCPTAAPNATVLKYATTPGEYQTQLTELTNAGYRTKVVNGYVVGNLAYYDTIYALGSGPDWSMVYGVDATRFQTKLEEMAGLGYKVTDLSACTISGGFTYSAVWDR